MITIIHGEDETASKNKLHDLKETYREKEIIALDGKNLTITDLTLALETRSLFAMERVIIVENLLSRKPSKDKDELVKYIVKEEADNNVILAEGKEVTPAVLKKLSQAKVINNKQKENIFKLVDNIRPKAGYELVPIFQELIKTEPAEIVFVMIVRQIRNLILAKDSSGDYLKELPPWQKSKFVNQAKYFTQDELVSLHRKLLDIDYKIKSGKSPLSLSSQLDIFLVNL